MWRTSTKSKLGLKYKVLIAMVMAVMATILLTTAVDAQNTGTIVFILTIGNTGWSHVGTINGVQGTNISNLDNITTTKIQTIDGITP